MIKSVRKYFIVLSSYALLSLAVNAQRLKQIKIGDAGVAQSKIGPIGKALINDISCEVQTLGEWINSGTSIEVIKVSLNKIIVKAKT